jgi:hypothetical protein
MRQTKRQTKRHRRSRRLFFRLGGSGDCEKLANYKDPHSKYVSATKNKAECKKIIEINKKKCETLRQKLVENDEKAEKFLKEEEMIPYLFGDDYSKCDEYLKKFEEIQ